jgi:two-component system, cell cycle response regulator
VFPDSPPAAPPPPPFRPIASNLIQGTVILAIVCMVGVFVVQSLLMVQQHSKQYQLVVDEIARNSVPLLSVSLWDIELKTVQSQVDLIAQRPQIGFVQVNANIGRRFVAGDPALKDGPVSLRIKIPAPEGAGGTGAARGVVGELSIVGNQQYLLGDVLKNALSVLIGYGIFTALICGLITYMLRRELQIPLQHMARFATEITPQTLTQPLELDRPRRANVDEIDQVADGFSKLQHGLREHITRLDHMVEERTAQLKALAETNRVLSITDELTGCLNRRTLDLRLSEELSRSQRYQRNLSVICLDLDFFKRINDTYGHAAGDEVLRSVGQLLRQSTRLNLDWIVRMGGEEFLIVLPETELAPAQAHAERLRQAIEAQPVVHEGRAIRLTASLGVAQWTAPESGQSLIMRADTHQYEAKEAGRNQVFPPLPPSMGPA